MFRFAPVLAVLLLAGCDTASAPTLTTAPPGAPTTSIVGDTCERLATDTARYLEVVVRVVDGTPIDEFRDRGRWAEPLLALEEQGRDLDTRARSMRCDEEWLRSRAFAEARLEAQTGLGRYVLHRLHGA